MKIGVLIDSTASISPKMKESKNLNIVDLSTTFENGHTYKSSDITLEQLFDEIEKTKSLPNTSQPSPGDFMEVYEELSNKYDKVYFFTISEKLSGTHQGAVSAAGGFDKISIHSCCGGASCHAIMTDKVLELIEQEKYEEIEPFIKEYQRSIKSVIVPETLKNLSYGGRVPSALNHVSGALNLKLVLQMIDNNEVEIMSKGIGFKSAVKTILADLEKHKVKEIYITPYIMEEKNYNFFTNKVNDMGIKIHECKGDVVIGTHFGKGTLSLAYLRGDNNED